MKTIGCISLALIILSSCAPAERKVDLEKEREALLAIHKKSREGDFNRNGSQLVDNSVDDFFFVNSGDVNRLTKQQRLQMYERSFDGATYSRWDDLEEPIIRISDDGTLAWMITRLEVARTKKDSTGIEHPEGFVYAGMMTFKKVDGEWVKEANVSTFREAALGGT